MKWVALLLVIVSMSFLASYRQPPSSWLVATWTTVKNKTIKVRTAVYCLNPESALRLHSVRVERAAKKYPPRR